MAREVPGSPLPPRRDFRRSRRGVAVGAEVGAVGNDANDAGDDAVSPRHPHSQIVTATSEDSLTSAKEETRIKTRNTYLYLRLHRTDDSHTIYAVPSIFFIILHMWKYFLCNF